MGADLLMRACYMPGNWGLRAFIHDAGGACKGGEAAAPAKDAPAGPAAGSREPCDADSSGGGVLTDIAGPLCFQGDRLAVARLLPHTEPGDWVVVADAGAYTLSMYSRCVCVRGCVVAGGLPLSLLVAGLQVVGGPACTWESLGAWRAWAHGPSQYPQATGPVPLLVRCRRYNSRCSPPVYGFSGGSTGGGDGVRLQLLRPGETLEQVLAFWNGCE